jgi:tRNA/tmRNA/rRNA uracil-C5-methylase (TrmA/RlmC/RlmD family)
VLWDAANQEELDGVVARVLAHMDQSLPLVDVGCGNGRFSRLLAAHFPKVLGVDISAHAIKRANEVLMIIKTRGNSVNFTGEIRAGCR